jgi:hypothetical protein
VGYFAEQTHTGQHFPVEAAANDDLGIVVGIAVGKQSLGIVAAVALWPLRPGVEIACARILEREVAVQIERRRNPRVGRDLDAVGPDFPAKAGSTYCCPARGPVL